MAIKYIGALDLAAPADTNWHDLSSDDFYDQTDGAAAPAKLAAGLSFESVTFVNTSANAGIYMLGPAEVGPASATHKLPMPANSQTSTADLRESRSGFRAETVAYKKGGAADAIWAIVELWSD